MNRFFLLIACFFVFDCTAQLLPRANATSIHRVKRDLKKSLRNDHGIRAIEMNEFISDSRFVLIPSYRISKKAVDYDTSRNIAEFLTPNNKQSYEYGIVYRGEYFVGSIDCSNAVLFEGREPCVYNDSPKTARYQGNFELSKGLELLKSKNPSFIFSVQYFRNTLWFLQGDKVFLLNLNDFSIYGADEFIRKKCSVETIRNLSKGDLSVFCN